MTHASVFSGIGGAELAAYWMGWQNLFHCEIQEFPRCVLEYWFPNSVSYEDITKTDFHNGEIRLTSSLEDFLVNHSLLQDEEEERKMTAISGHLCLEQYGRFSQLGSLLKMLLESHRWWCQVKKLKWEEQTVYSRRITYIEKSRNMSSTEYGRILNQKDIVSYRLLFRLVPLAHHIEETESGLLPTVQTQGLKICNKKGKTTFFPMNLLPTPTTLDKGSGRMNKSLSENSSERPTFGVAARLRLLPTPNAIEATKYSKKINPKSQMGTGLTARAMNGILGPINTKIDGRTFHLNPLYVADMMGFPSMWTTLPFLSPNGGKNQ